MQATAPLTTDRIRVIPWLDPYLEESGFKSRSRYVETYWLGILGPSTTLLLRLLADEVEHHNDGVILDLYETAAKLGIGMRGGKYSPFLRSIGRLTYFGLAELRGDNTLAVRCYVPFVAPRHLVRLPRSLQKSHQHLLRQLETKQCVG